MYAGFKLVGELIYKYVDRRDIHRKQVLFDYHDSPLSCHGGAKKRLAQIQTRYFWPAVAKEVKEYVKKCQICQTTKNPTKTFRSEMVIRRLEYDSIGSYWAFAKIPNIKQFVNS